MAVVVAVISRPRLRIVNDGPLGHTAKVFVITDNGEIDISTCLTGVDIRMRVGALSTVSLHAIDVSVETRATLDQLHVEKIPDWRDRARRVAKLLA